MKKLLFTLTLALSMFTTVTFAAANAGTEQTVISNDMVQLDGTASMFDYDGTKLKYSWKQLKKHTTPKVILANKESVTPTFIAPDVTETTELVFRLKTVELYNCKGSKGSKGSKDSKGSKGSKGSKNKHKKKCRKYKSFDRVSIFVSPLMDNNDTNMTGVTISGQITDINGTGINGATVIVDGKTATTDMNGYYMLMSVIASTRVSIDVTHLDYLANSRIVDVNTSDITLDIKLGMPKATLTFNAMDGATVTETSGASVMLPINGYVDANGSPYSGMVTVRMSYYPITTQSGRATFPGTFEGIEGNTTFPIQSYGFMNVELTDPQGNALNLDGNSTATLTFPRDTNIYSPSTIPLWYYDKALGYWVEDGEATNNADYNKYVGTVTHFTSWNLDAKGPRASLTGCVQDENGTLISNANVQFRSINWDSYIVPTDANGSISVINILAQTDLTFSATAKIATGFYYGEYPTSINLIEGENKILTDCVVLKKQGNLPTTITVTGTYLEYDYSIGLYLPVANRTINIYTGRRSYSQIITTGITNNAGTFSITFDIGDALRYTVGTNIYGGKAFTIQPNKNIYDIGEVKESLAF